MYLKLNYAIFLLIFFSCRGKKNEIRVNNLANNTIAVRPKLDLKKCIPEDIIITKKTSIKYIIQDTSFDVKIQINNKDTVLGFHIDCNFPPGLIPELYTANKNTICLFRGYSDHFREFIICHMDSNKIFIKKYEPALTVDLKNNNVVCGNYHWPDSIYVENIRTNKRKIFVLPEKLKYQRISNTYLKDQSLKITFENGKKIRFSLNSK